MDQTYSKALLLVLFLVVAGYVLSFLKKALHGSAHHEYKAKGPYLLSAGEKRFFDALIQVIPLHLYICPKVRMADLVEVNLSKDDKKFWKTFNQISQKHVDFVLCDKSDFSPKLIIELDGGSHQQSSRSQRDQFVDDVFGQAGISIIHIAVVGDYAGLANQINGALSVASTPASIG